MTGERFAVALTCIDGRVHEQLPAALRERWDVEHLDLVTAPGPEALLADAPDDHHVWAAIRVSVEEHRARHLAVIAHTDCAGNRAPVPVRRDQLRRTVARARRLFPDLEVESFCLDTERGTLGHDISARAVAL